MIIFDVRNKIIYTTEDLKFDGTGIDDIEDFDLVMPIYSLIEYNSNYCETTGILWLNN